MAATIHGEADVGFGPVADAFAANFAEGGELGAAVALYVGGRRVVYLWGGIADRRTSRSWLRDTPALFFSVTKGVLAICAYRLVGRAASISMLPWRATGPNSPNTARPRHRSETSSAIEPGWLPSIEICP